MSDWTDGYVAGIDYTYGYYGELNPLRVAMPFLNAGLAPPAIATACELGFGQGVSINIHAAASGIRWWGTDFNPSHAAFARSLAAASGSGAELFDQSFAEFCARPDLPDFDYIGLHGVWSWISEANEKILVDFLRRKLKVGGVAYVSYNTQPGFAAMVPLRQLLMQHAEAGAGAGFGIVAQIDAALDFADKLLAINTSFAVANPTITQRVAAIKGQPRSYLAHEYFNRDWRVIQFGEMAERLAAAKLSFACSTHPLDHIDALNLTPDQQRFLSGIGDPVFRQAVRDFMVNQQFRRDYWVKGPRRLSPLEQAETVRQFRVMLCTPRSDMAFTVAGALGPRDMATNVYGPILDLLGEHDAMTLGEVEAALRDRELRLATIYEAMIVLAGKSDLALVQSEEAQATARAHTDRLNRHLFDKARAGGDLAFLASPVIGGGFAVPRFHQLFLLALRHERQGADELAQFVWDILAPQNQRVLKDGKALETPEENLTELAAQARDFIDKRLALYQKLQVA